MKIVVLDGYTENPGDLSWDDLKALGDLTVYDRTAADQIVNRIGDAEAVYTNKTPISAETLAACPNLKFIGVLATGYNIVDVSSAKEHGVVVSNIPTYGTDAVGQNMGIIGFGRIGRTTARIAKALGMNILAYDAYRPDDRLLEGYQFTALDNLLSQSDVISLHCPLFPETQGLINRDTISKMKDGVIILNNSRGPLIVEQDLADALNSGKVYAAGLDVVSTEPIKGDNPLLKAKNCLITPHISWAPKESRQRLMNIAVENLRQFQKGAPVNVVSK